MASLSVGTFGLACVTILLTTCIGYAEADLPTPLEIAKKFKGSDKLQQCSFRFSLAVPGTGPFEAAVRGTSIVALKHPNAVAATAKEAQTKKQKPKEVPETMIQLSMIANHRGLRYNSPVPVELEYVENSKSYMITNAKLGMMLFDYERHTHANREAPKLIDLTKSEQLLRALEGILAADETELSCAETGMETYSPQDFPSHVYGLAKKIARTRALDPDNKFNCDSFTIDVQDDSSKEKNEAQVQIELRTIKAEENKVFMHINLVDKSEDKLYVSSDEIPTLLVYDEKTGTYDIELGRFYKHSMTYKNVLWSNDGSLDNTGALGGTDKEINDFLKLTNALAALFTKDDSKALELWRCGTIPAVRSKFQFIVRKVLNPEQFAKLSKQQKLVTGDTTKYSDPVTFEARARVIGGIICSTLRIGFKSKDLKGDCEAYVPMDQVRIGHMKLASVPQQHLEFPLQLKADDGWLYETAADKPVRLLWEPTNRKYQFKSATVFPVLAEHRQKMGTRFDDMLEEVRAKGVDLSNQPGFKAAMEKMLRFDFGLSGNDDFPCGPVTIPYLAPDKMANHLKAIQKELGAGEGCTCMYTDFTILGLTNRAAFWPADVKISGSKISITLTVIINDVVDGVSYFESPEKFPTEMTFYGTNEGRYEITQPVIQKVSKNEKERDFIEITTLGGLEAALMSLVAGHDKDARRRWKCGWLRIPESALPTPPRKSLNKEEYEAYLKKKQEEAEAKAKKEQADREAAKTIKASAKKL